MATWHDIELLVGTSECGGCRFTLAQDPDYNPRAEFPIGTIVLLTYVNRRNQRVDVLTASVRENLLRHLHARLHKHDYTVHVTDEYNDGVELIIQCPTEMP